MKKMVVLTVVLLVSAIGFTACSIPNMGKMEIVNAVKEAAGSAEEPAAPESADSAAAPSAAPSAENSPALNDAEMQELIDEGIVSEDVVREEDGNAVYDKQEINDVLKKYTERIDCKTTVINGNNMIVQVKNNNDVTIPKLTVHVNYPSGEKAYDFCQVPSGGQIVIPVEKGDGDLPPAVSANASVSMNSNEYVGLSSNLNVAESKTKTSYTLTLTNTADRACKKLNVAVLFSNDSGVICALTASAPNEVAPGASATFTFTLPQNLIDAGLSFTGASYVINEAVG